jgi:hypothetical protein
VVPVRLIYDKKRHTDTYGTGGGISVKVFPGDATAINVGWDIGLDQAADHADHLTERFNGPLTG